MNVSEELNYFTNLNAIYVQLLFHNAEAQKLNLNIETSQVENINNMNQMNDLVALITSPSVPNGEFGKKNNAVGKLGSISNTQTLIADFEDLKERYEFLSHEWENLKSKNEMLINENENLKKNTSKFSGEISLMAEHISNLQKEAKSGSTSLDTVKLLERELTETKNRLDQQISKYQDLMSEYDKKLSESTQFKQLKKFITEKNALNAELKKKLAVYEKSD